MKMTKEQAAKARNVPVCDVLHFYGVAPPPKSLARVWPGGRHVMTFFTDCPICHNEFWMEHPSRWFCATCRAEGDVIKLVQFLTGATTQQAIGALCGAVRFPTRGSKAVRQTTSAKRRHIEDVAQQYGLALEETAERPARSPVSDLVGAATDWASSRWGGKTYITRCPICEGPLFVYFGATLQLWTCRQCNKGYSCREFGQDGDVIELVRHITGCTHNHAIWYLGGNGPQPRRKNPG